MIEALLKDTTHALGIPGQYGDLEGAGWIVGLNETDAVILRHLPDDGRICFEYEVGEVPADHREALFGLFLTFNYATLPLPGLRVGLLEDKTAVLLVELSDQNLETPKVVEVIELLAENGPAWRNVLTASAHGVPDAPSSLPPPGTLV